VAHVLEIQILRWCVVNVVVLILRTVGGPDGHMGANSLRRVVPHSRSLVEDRTRDLMIV